MNITNPDKIVLINKYYPKGLTKKDIADYYNKNKKLILSGCVNRPVFLFMSFSKRSKIVVKRHLNERQLIFLNSNNYDKILNGYVISISIETPDPTPYWCIDLDYSNNVSNLEKIDSLEKIIEIIKDHTENIRITNSSTGYHVYGYLNRKQNLASSKKVLLSILKMSVPGNMSLTRNRRITVDLSPMNRRGGSTLIGSLTRSGIICTDITENYRDVIPERDFTIK